MNNGIYQPYQPYQPQPSINWVAGYEGARQFPLTRNGAVVLLDSEADKFYIKTCDNIGMCDIRVFSFKEEKNDKKGNNVIGNEKYVTREEFNKLLAELGGISNEPLSTNDAN